MNRFESLDAMREVFHDVDLPQTFELDTDGLEGLTCSHCSAPLNGPPDGETERTREMLATHCLYFPVSGKVLTFHSICAWVSAQMWGMECGTQI